MSLLEIVGSILTELEKVHQKLDRLLASKVEKDWSLLEGASEQPTYPEPKKEEGKMDLTKVTLLKETRKAFLAYKDNLQVWIAKSHLEGVYKLGNICDLIIKNERKWVLDDLDWKPFEVFKD